MSDAGTPSSTRSEARDDTRAGARVRSVVVSGAGGAVGRVMAARFEAHGCRLVLPTRGDPEVLQRLFPGARVLRATVSDPEDARRVVREAEDAFGGPDAVLAVAGGFAVTPAATLTLDELDAMLATNLATAVALVTAALPGMLTRGFGRIVGVSAGVATRGGARVGAYAASKAALEGYLRSVRAELAGQDVDASVVVPEGTIDTPANRRAMPNADPAGWIAPDALAEAAWFLATRSRGGRVAELRVSA